MIVILRFQTQANPGIGASALANEWLREHKEAKYRDMCIEGNGNVLYLAVEVEEEPF